MRLLPHALDICGRIYFVRWGSTNDPHWNAIEDEAQVVYCASFGAQHDGDVRCHDAAADGQEPYTITLHPKLRRESEHRQLEALWHEVLHVINHYEPSRRKALPLGELMRIQAYGGRWRNLPHDLVHRLDTALATALSRAVKFVCVCATCGEDRAKKIARVTTLVGEVLNG